MKLTIHATFKEAVSRETLTHTFIRLEFVAVKQPELPPLFSNYATDNPIGFQYLETDLKALRVTLPSQLNWSEVPNLINAGVEPVCTVALECNVRSYEGRQYLAVERVREVGG